MRNLWMVLGSLLVVAACESPTFQQWYEYPITVTELHHPEQVAPGQPIEIGFEGYVGNTTCHRFERVEVFASTAAGLELVVVGRVEVDARSQCEEVDIYLDPAERFRYTGPTTDPFRIIVHQPAGDSLVSHVRIQ
jgi:hypothetical protein